MVCYSCQIQTRENTNELSNSVEAYIDLKINLLN